jgi:uncharacterized membrane protein
MTWRHDAAAARGARTLAGYPGDRDNNGAGLLRHVWPDSLRSDPVVSATMGIRATVESALPAVRHGVSERASRLGTAHLLGVGVLTAAMAAIYSAYSLVLYYTFQTTSYDLVIFDEAVRSYAHFRPGISIIKGVHNGFGPDFSVLGDHWSPILAALAPLYWIHDSPETLLVAQAVLFALAIPPLWLFTRRAFGGGRKATVAAYLVSVAYGLSWPIAAALAFDFHEVAFAPVLTAVALERLQAGRLRPALIALAALLLVKEDMGLFVAGIGCFLAVSRPRVSRQRLVAIALIAGGIADTVLATYVLIPAFGGRADYYWAYSSLGPGVPQAAWHLIAHPASSLRLLVTPRVKLVTILWLFGAFCFLPLLSPISLAVLPLLLERMLASIFPAWWGTPDQYNAYLVVVLLCAAVDGAARLDRWACRRRAAGRVREGGPAQAGGRGAVALVCAAAMCALAVYLVPRFEFGPALHASFYQRDARMNAAAAADAAVPSGVTVEAVNDLGPQLSRRDTVLLLDQQPRWAPWVVADVAQPEFNFTTVNAERQRVALLERSGYRIVFKREGYVVLHRAGRPAGTAGARAAAG